MQVFARIESLEGRDRRSVVRHKLQLDITLAGTGDKVVIHNLSPTGILIETAAQLATSDEFEVDLPDRCNGCDRNLEQRHFFRLPVPQRDSPFRGECSPASQSNCASAVFAGLR